jgi:hypothetical protein
MRHVPPNFTLALAGLRKHNNRSIPNEHEFA